MPPSLDVSSLSQASQYAHATPRVGRPTPTSAVPLLPATSCARYPAAVVLGSVFGFFCVLSPLLNASPLLFEPLDTYLLRLGYFLVIILVFILALQAGRTQHAPRRPHVPPPHTRLRAGRTHGDSFFFLPILHTAPPHPSHPPSLYNGRR